MINVIFQIFCSTKEPVQLTLKMLIDSILGSNNFNQTVILISDNVYFEPMFCPMPNLELSVVLNPAAILK